jgi:hypothetical protein
VFIAGLAVAVLGLVPNAPTTASSATLEFEAVVAALVGLGNLAAKVGWIDEVFSIRIQYKGKEE